MLIAFLLPDNGHSLEVSGPADVFEAANREYGRLVYNLQFISESPDPITCLCGLRVLPDLSIGEPDVSIDTLIVAGSLDPGRKASPRLIDWVRQSASSTRRYGSVWTGAFLLGAAGLLDNRKVTTQSEFAQALAAAFPLAIVESDRTVLRDGALFTAAGVAAGIDLALSLVEEDHGASFALAVARSLSLFAPRTIPQSQLSKLLASHAVSRSPIQLVQDWIRDNFQLQLSVQVLAQRAGMGDRTFARVFRSKVGVTPIEFVEATRVEVGRRLLEETDLPLQRVAPACGFSTPQAFRRAFHRRFGIMPARYRSRLRSSRREQRPPATELFEHN
jgi:transcriptional regulator GlxA family with amidase domain